MRKLAWFAGSFSAGIFLAQYCLEPVYLLPAAFAFLALGCGALLLPYELRRRALLACVAVSLSLGYHWLYIRQVQRPMEALAGTESQVVMTLCGEPEATDYGARVEVQLEGLPGKVMYYGPSSLLECLPGQTVTDTVLFQSASKIRDSDVTTFTSKGIFLLAYQRGEAEVSSGTEDALRWQALRVGRDMRERIGMLLEGDAAAFLMAILTGDRSAVSASASADLSEAGLSHILAVSGMHCGFLLTMAYLLTGRWYRGTMVIAPPLLVFYVFLTGASPSVVRACVMLGFWMAAPLVHRQSDGPTTLTTALLVILVKNPFAAASISLQLSFAAIAGLQTVTPRLAGMLRKKKEKRLIRLVKNSFSATMGALVFTAPLCALYFGTLVLISPVSNLLCLWSAGVVFISGLITVAVSVFSPPLAALMAFIPGLTARYILAAAHLLASVPGHAVYLCNPYVGYWMVFAYLLFGVCWLLRRGPRRRYALSAGLAAVSLTASVWAGRAAYRGDLDAVMLDVDQGQSIILASHGTFALVDCGSSASWYGPGEMAAQQLSAMGCGTLDYLILTHFDADHISGVEELLARMPTERILVPEPLSREPALLQAAEASGTAVEVVEQQRELELGQAALTVFPPLEGETDANDAGLVILAAVGEHEMLITGDLSAGAEARLLETWELPDIEVLAAGHHGAADATSAELLDALTPEIVCISVGENNRYGHPATETLRRLGARGCAVYRTDLHGDIHLSWNRGDTDGIRKESAGEE